MQGAAQADRGPRRREVGAGSSNRDDAYADAIKKFPQYKDVAGKDAFPASFIVKLDDPEQHKAFDDSLVGQPGVLNVPNQKDLIDRLFARARRAQQCGVRRRPGAGGRRDSVDSQHGSSRRVYAANREVGIMRLVGASRWYTQLPFLVEAMLAALSAS